MTSEQRGTIQARDGVTLATAAWVPEAPKAAILLSHGHAEHLGRYRHVIAALAERGYAVIGQDHRGHGRSGGERALAMRFDDFVDDLRLLHLESQERYPSLPFAMLGHSMGGLIAARYALAYQADLVGVVISGAAFIVDHATPSWQKPVARFVSRFLPKAPVPRSSDVDSLSTDPEVKAAFKADPLCWNGPTRMRTAVEMVNAGADALARASTLTIPLLAMHGADDQITSPDGTRQFYAAASSEDKTLTIWPGMKHEIFNEVAKASVIAATGDWLDGHLPPR